MRQLFYLIILIFNIFSTTNIAAQHQTDLRSVKKFVDQWNSFKSISYVAKTSEKSLFSEDTLQRVHHTELILDSSRKVIALKEHIKASEYEFTNLFNGQQSFYLGNNNTYEVRKNINLRNEVFGLAGKIDSISYYLKNNSNKIQLLADTLINGINCYYFRFVQSDVKTPEKRTFEYSFFAFSKNNFSPVYYKNMLRGEVSAGGISLGVLNLYSETLFSNVQKNNLEYDLTNFSPPSSAQIAKNDKKELLKSGEMSPAWAAEGLDGLNYSSSQFLGKNTLLFLTVIDCPANQLSINTINNIINKYPQDKIQVIGLFAESKDRVQKYSESNPIKFPIISNAKEIKENYHAFGSPYYYLIDKEGKVFKSSFGYSDGLEKQLIDSIEEMMTMSVK